jgi:hypothetical protein
MQSEAVAEADPGCRRVVDHDEEVTVHRHEHLEEQWIAEAVG